MPDLFDNINDWLLTQALSDMDIADTLEGLAGRLKDGGIPIARISLGRSVLHPTIGLIDLEWLSETGRIEINVVPRKSISIEMFHHTPFGEISLGHFRQIVADLRDQAEQERYEIFRNLAERGMTGYVAYKRSFGYRPSNLADDAFSRFRGANVSFATKRFSGFSEADVAGLERLVTALCICTRVDNDRFLLHKMLETYLGRISGELVLSGAVTRADRQQIDCAILYSDLKGSVALSQNLDTDAYLDSVNAYFECIVHAVEDHGGEVLKLIGDGVLAIFPFDDNTRPRSAMCTAALASAREAFARADFVNRARAKEGLPDIAFGIALHVGEVIYGNVGTDLRMDFTATGPAVGLAARVEALTRRLAAPLLATEAFAQCCNDAANPIEPQQVKDFDAPIKLVHYEL